MIRALDTAAMGMLKAQKRATELAGDILKTTSGQQAEAETGSKNAGNNASSPFNSGPNSAATSSQEPRASQTTSLIHQISEFKLAELQFRASATAFKRIADTSEASLGLLVDKKG